VLGGSSDPGFKWDFRTASIFILLKYISSWRDLGSVSKKFEKKFTDFQSAGSYTFHTSQFSRVVFTYWLTKVQLLWSSIFILKNYQSDFLNEKIILIKIQLIELDF
jgi:hypothetical protein